MKRGFCLNLVVMGIVFVVLASLAGAQGSGPQSEAGIQATVGTGLRLDPAATGAGTP